MQVVSIACLLLGAKVEEAPKPLREVVRVVCQVRYAHEPAELEAVLSPVRLQDTRHSLQSHMRVQAWTACPFPAYKLYSEPSHALSVAVANSEAGRDVGGVGLRD